MPRARTAIRTIVLAVTLFALASTGRAQPAPRATAIPVIPALVPYIGDEGVQKELKLDADQTKKLLAHRQKLWDEAWTTAPKNVDLDAQHKATVAEFKAVLTADQLKRANQLATQIVWREQRGFGPGPSALPSNSTPDPHRVSTSALTQYPEIAEALKPDEAQKKLADITRGRFGSNVYLTSEQSDRAKELLGAEYKGTLRRQTDPRAQVRAGPFDGGFSDFDGRFGIREPVALRYTSAPDVQKELKLTADQLKELTELRTKWNRRPFVEAQAQSPEARKNAQDKLLAETEKALDKILTADQRTRLRQIERQQSRGPILLFVRNTEWAKELEITDAQRKQYDAAVEAHGEAVAKALVSDEPFAKVRTAVEDANEAHTKAVDAILTDAQRAKQKELLGAAFTGSVSGGNTFPGPAPPSQTQKFTFGRYTTQLTTLTRFKGVRDELKLTDDQLKKVEAVVAEGRTKFNADLAAARQDEAKTDKVYADRSAHVEKALADILTKDQLARLHELELQRLESSELRRPFPTPGTAASYPGVAEAIKLTPEQKQKLLDGGKPTDVLTDDQKKAIAGMLGRPVKVAEVFDTGSPFPKADPPAPRARLSAAHQLVLSTIVWDELKLTRDQTEKLAAAANEYTLAGTRRTGFQPGEPKELVAAIETFGKAADAILTADQRKRLDQLVFQQAITSGMDSALLGSRATDLPTLLQLTDAQKKNLLAVSAEFGNVASLLDDASLPVQKETEIRRALRDRLDAGLLKALNAMQNATLKDLLGEPFTGFVKQPLYGRGGFGGGAGGVGGGFGDPFGP